jgi:3-oxoacyl-[acyl-carrier protein] reductase
MDLQLADKVALITGGGRGIGRQIATSLAREGVHVAVCGRTAPPLEAVAAEIEQLGVKSSFSVVDLLNPEDCSRAVEETIASFGRLDILVNNASTNVDSHPADLEQLSDEQLLERVMVKGVASVRCTRAALPYLREAEDGRIILLGGTSARVVPGPGGGFAGGLGNSFVGYLSKRLSAEVAGNGITVNLIHPGETVTDRYPVRMEKLAAKLGLTIPEAEAVKAAQIPIRRMVQPIDVASVAVFLASPVASAITGQVIAVDGGVTPTVIY